MRSSRSGWGFKIDYAAAIADDDRRIAFAASSMTPAQLDKAGTSLAMIHPVGSRQLLITPGRSPQALRKAVTALHEAGIDPVSVSNNVITIEYARSLREKNVIKALATVLRAAEFQPCLPGKSSWFGKQRDWHAL